MNETLRRLARDLESRGIAYSVIGAVALNQHGYQRFKAELVDRGYRPAFEGAAKTFRATAENVPIEVVIAGGFPGDGQPKPVVFPDPADCYVVIEGVRTVPIEKLVELKLASGMSGLDRLKDLADVMELIRIRGLDAAFAERLDPFVRAKYPELHEALVRARDQRDRPVEEP